jgi:2-polyprenyl-3-methyl-5-hydroxy-6-metoxy-1,4-benzoquinol methylase
MPNEGVVEINKCWCGSVELETFNGQYKKCKKCFTLINSPRQVSTYYEVENERDDEAFYGKNYWMGHQTEDLGHPSIFQRSRRDLSERCLYWLQTVLKYRLPSGNTLEIGSGPGAFVQMLSQAGFSSKGLELSPWVAEYGGRTHGVEIINSKIEDVSDELEPHDIIVMMDVLEHFPDPVETMSHVKKVLAAKGILVIQTPCYNHMTYQQMVDTNDPFLIQLKDQEHLYLLSKEAISLLLDQLGIHHVQFLDPLFPYDMFVVASAEPLQLISDEQVVDYLASSPATRLVLAMLDLYKENNRLFNEAEQRLRNNEKLEQSLRVSDQDRNARLQAITELEKLLMESEQDRNARLKSIQTLEQLLRESEQDRQARLESIHVLEKLLKEKSGGVQE